MDNLRVNREQYPAERCEIEVMAVLRNRGLARDERIATIPALVRGLLEPDRKITSDHLDAERMLVGLDWRKVGGRPSASGRLFP